MYHNIYKTRNGKYQILKHNEFYGAYDNLVDALQERDDLESVAWDIDKLCDLSHPRPNKYENIDLPPFEHIPRYIQIDTERNKIRFAIVKLEGCKRKRYGRYKTLEEAEHVRDLLIEHDWDKKKVKQILREERSQLS